MIARLSTLSLMIILLGGCATSPQDTGPNAGMRGSLPKNQSQPLALVKIKAEDLSLGMTQRDVRRLLGEPARIDGDVWFYLPNQDGSFQLDKKLRIKFFGDEYISKGYFTTFAADYAYPLRGH